VSLLHLLASHVVVAYTSNSLAVSNLAQAGERAYVELISDGIAGKFAIGDGISLNAILAILGEVEDILILSPLGELTFVVLNAVVDDTGLAGEQFDEVSVDTVGGVAVEYGSTGLLGGFNGCRASLVGEGSLGGKKLDSPIQ
jgi:hypothetical protein